VEQLPPLCVSGDWDRRDRIGVDRARLGTEGARSSASDFPSPRFVPTTGARPWGNRRTAGSPEAARPIHSSAEGVAAAGMSRHFLYKKMTAV